MKANSGALKITMARACMNTEDLVKAAEMPRPTAYVSSDISGIENEYIGEFITPEKDIVVIEIS